MGIAHKSNCHSYNGVVEDTCISEPRSDTSMPEVKITGSDSDSSTDTEVLQWEEMKNSHQPHSTKHTSRAYSILG
jgi:hypothetical protein